MDGWARRDRLPPSRPCLLLLESTSGSRRRIFAFVTSLFVRWRQGEGQTEKVRKGEIECSRYELTSYPRLKWDFPRIGGYRAARRTKRLMKG